MVCLPVQQVQQAGGEVIEELRLSSNPRRALLDLQATAEDMFNNAAKRGDEPAAYQWFRMAFAVVGERMKIEDAQTSYPGAATGARIREEIQRNERRRALLKEVIERAKKIQQTKAETENGVALLSLPS